MAIPQRLAVQILHIGPGTQQFAKCQLMGLLTSLSKEEIKTDDHLVAAYGGLIHWAPHAGFGPDHIFFGSH